MKTAGNEKWHGINHHAASAHGHNKHQHRQKQIGVAS